MLAVAGATENTNESAWLDVMLTIFKGANPEFVTTTFCFFQAPT